MKKSDTSHRPERRKHDRLNVVLPMECQVKLIDGQEYRLTTGVLKNISPGGLYFVCGDLPSIRRGDIGEFNVNIATEPNSPVASHILTRGQVKRIEHHVTGLVDYGVAVEFISRPSFA